MTKKKNINLLTRTELELMNALWSLGEGTVRDILGVLPHERNMAYTSAATIIKILEKKNYVKSQKKEKAHIFYPVIKKSDYEQNTIQHVVHHVFDGTPVNLVKRLLEDSKLSTEERQKIKNMIKELK
ncbi:MAG: BlaI/MecI/CopY family transcriptional regulator [Deltaproteobacteria bacterium]|nr:BlaI/MecI/CopY family transcriptional regulator [Deltaproteobacteria bacterium]